MNQAFKVIYRNKSGKIGMFIFTSPRSEAKANYNRLLLECDVEEIIWKGTIEQWEYEQNSKKKPNAAHRITGADTPVKESDKE